jgi:hypothetical protein
MPERILSTQINSKKGHITTKKRISRSRMNKIEITFQAFISNSTL